ncbi:unnamed protein product [Bursaphelenchus xylophilus]|uniref:(pine wood nematode) hypothetical protein n=1 Tax=Bursaphelenchus xylophilus TaxID=6326 RepID=A0A1I7SFY1_BURXY|nr:unnamed protein product [Bursaphelenchus xylophilus]CAG9128511.1 unnamed protein product [Bursaphelenchus xylophilus]
MQAICVFGLLFLAAVYGISVRPDQKIAVKGRLKCDGKPAEGIKVKLYDHDTFTLDDLIGETKTGKDGAFEISGDAHEITNITPKINVYHKCDKVIPICDIKFSIEVPKKYIEKGEAFDAGELNLEGKFEGQSTDCLN